MGNFHSVYRHDPKFLDRHVCANNVNPDQTLIRVYTVCHSVCNFWMHYPVVKPPCSNFRIIKSNFSGVRIFRIFTLFSKSLQKSAVLYKLNKTKKIPAKIIFMLRN